MMSLTDELFHQVMMNLWMAGVAGGCSASASAAGCGDVTADRWTADTAGVHAGGRS